MIKSHKHEIKFKNFFSPTHTEKYDVPRKVENKLQLAMSFLVLLLRPSSEIRWKCIFMNNWSHHFQSLLIKTLHDSIKIGLVSLSPFSLLRWVAMKNFYFFHIVLLAVKKKTFHSFLRQRIEWKQASENSLTDS